MDIKQALAERDIQDFCEEYGQAHLYLAYHAALPLALTPDLLYHIWANFQRDVQKGDFVYLPPWCEHGIENTGTETLVVLIATSPPNP